MGGSGQKYGQREPRLTEEEIRRRHRGVDDDAYLFDIEYEKLKKEEDRLQAEYTEEMEKLRRITERLREEMLNGTSTESGMARYMAALTDRGVMLEQEQEKLQENLEKISENRADVQNQLNALRRTAFAGSTNAQAPTGDRNYNGFKAENRRKAEIVEMSPQEYIRRAAFGANGAGSLRSLLNSSTPSVIQRYMRQMLRGTKYATPAINNGGRASLTDTNRVLAALMNGYKRIPVMVVE